MAKGKYEKWIEPDGLLLLETWARDGLTDEQIAHNMGVAYSTLRVWRDKFSALSAALKRGKEVIPTFPTPINPHKRELFSHRKAPQKPTFKILKGA